MGRSQIFFLCLLFCIFFVENASVLLFQIFLSSHSKQALTQLFPLTLSLQALLNPVLSPQCCCQDIFGPFFPFSSSSSLFSPPILFTFFLLSLASTLQCVLESYFTKARDHPLDSSRFQELPHRQFNTKRILRITFYLII